MIAEVFKIKAPEKIQSPLLTDTLVPIPPDFVLECTNKVTVRGRNRAQVIKVHDGG